MSYCLAVLQSCDPPVLSLFTFVFLLLSFVFVQSCGLAV